jgi:uncharacterized protein (TIGR00255 family)
LTIHSMTGYAAVTREVEAGTVTLELRSVNSRFLDLQFRMQDELRVVEPALREAITARVQRGKVECRLNFGRKSAESDNQSVNATLLDSLQMLQQQVRQRFPEAAPFTVAELLRWPGVIEETEIGQESLQTEIQDAMRQALDAFMESRAREGAALASTLISRIDEMEAIIRRITPLVPQAVAQFQQKATERLQEALGIALQNNDAGTNPSLPREEVIERIRQEVTVYGIRIDIAEELTRLSAHLSETRHILKKGGQVGKRLDFMMQELNREANTIGSKAAVKDLSDASMALKLLIEQMREQVQNLE